MQNPTIYAFTMMEAMMIMSLVGTIFLWVNQTFHSPHLTQNSYQILSKLQAEATQLIVELNEAFTDNNQFTRSYFSQERLKNEYFLPVIPAFLAPQKMYANKLQPEEKPIKLLPVKLLVEGGPFHYLSPPRAETP